MILQTGLRTDIPAFYTPWLLNRLRAGFALVRNPYNPSLVTRYSLSPDVVDVICFCTKNPAPMLPHLGALRGYAGQVWFVTVTPYGPEIEPHVPPKGQVLDAVRALARAVGPECVIWRYDPIFLDAAYPVERHVQAFARFCAALEGATHTCVISFLDLYEKTRRNFPQGRAVPPAQQAALAAAFVPIAARHGIRVKACAEGQALARFGVDCTGCMTLQTYETALHAALRPPKGWSRRAGCSCLLGNDIGAYNTCGHLCRYCYANYDATTVRRNMRLHDPASPMLAGALQPGDKIHTASQQSWLDLQLHF